ncbi:DUF1071 domain-containing protein [Fructobacillus sp. M158]|uniref:Sak single strand annealing protein n=1 Tax=Fructobacillus parabroussonetiae TaxID=2713174 RepID=UPI00200A081A|nr:DUF1071 domain-containing protein [Fructobacillus parabroussonetiae]MCK8618017.1 DUF1071 domain-containing protein [Fructobacillus parabroussonetiae]
MSEEMNSFQKLYEIDVSEHVERKKTGYTELSYLSWTYAWAEFAKRHSDATYEIKKFANDLPYVFDPNTGYMVFTSVTIDGITHEMWLPVMDGQNKAMKAQPYDYKTKKGNRHVEQASMTDINKAIMRCLVKNIAMFGLGLYIYSGEDLPDVEPKKITPEQANILDITIQNTEKVTGKSLLNWFTEQLGVAKISDLTEDNYKAAERFVNETLEKAKMKAEVKKEKEQTA